MTSQVSSLYRDDRLGITFAQYTAASHGVSVGYAVIKGVSVDRQILRFVGPRRGWVGLSLQGSLERGLVIAAWVNEDQVVASARYA